MKVHKRTVKIKKFHKSKSTKTIISENLPITSYEPNSELIIGSKKENKNSKLLVEESSCQPINPYRIISFNFENLLLWHSNLAAATQKSNSKLNSLRRRV